MTTTNNCTITLDVTGFGYTYLLQLLDMTDEFQEDGDNAAAAEALRDWIEGEAAHFLEEARANHDYHAADFFEGLTEEDTE